MTIPVSVCVWSLPGVVAEALPRIRQLGFERVDLEPESVAPREARLALERTGLRVHCMAIDHQLPGDLSLSSGDPDVLKRTIERLREVLDLCGELGGTLAYMTPRPAAPGSETAFTEALLALADHAEGLGIGLSLEHAPPAALPSVEEALAFLAGLAHPNLRILVDTGHCLLCGEDVESALQQAGDRLGYVHVNDNDGKRDLHWKPGQGVLDLGTLARGLRALGWAGYEQGIGIELSAALGDPEAAVGDTLRLLEEILG